MSQANWKEPTTMQFGIQTEKYFDGTLCANYKGKGHVTAECPLPQQPQSKPRFVNSPREDDPRPSKTNIDMIVQRIEVESKLLDQDHQWPDLDEKINKVTTRSSKDSLTLKTRKLR
ncbi:hypothetical protein O6H91_18G055300 [Diphasiastrum complanatum]|uniref:Uncharacterized protein n=1 Tax=Diphasiastrum complanatum TaxID=34168 RepID=A0ACC2B1C7_DIPCM|nr:hypothetical protein O6H91_18G055300 [Diphasiastrum complanatum]